MQLTTKRLFATFSCDFLLKCLTKRLWFARVFQQIPKDLHLPGRFGYPGHLLQHLQPHQFLHPALDPRLTFGTHGAFRPLSAFAPPQAKSLKTGVSFISSNESISLLSPFNNFERVSLLKRPFQLNWHLWLIYYYPTEI
jgi:hypothetical protein